MYKKNLAQGAEIIKCNIFRFGFKTKDDLKKLINLNKILILILYRLAKPPLNYFASFCKFYRIFFNTS